MSTPLAPDPALLYLSILASDWEFLPGLIEELVHAYGPVGYACEPFAFTQTTYYDAELGTPVWRRILGFDRLVEQDRLAAIKVWTNALERAGARPDGSRRFNLDPGLITRERLVLATGKNFTHRVYLGQGIYADLTLIYQRGAWRAFDWTFPDYAGEEMQTHLTTLRTRYGEKLAARREAVA